MPRSVQPRLDRLQGLQRARVDLVDGRAQQHDVAHALVADDAVVDAILEIAGVREVQALVDAQRDDRRVGDHLVAQHVAEVLGAGDPTDLGDVRAGAAVQEHEDRHRDAGADADLDTDAQGQQHRRGDGREVGARVAPRLLQDREVDERQHRDHDRRRERRLRQVADQRSERDRGERKADGGVRPGRGRLGPGIEVHDRAREAARDREAARERGAEIGGAQPDELLIGVHALALLRRERVRHRDRLDEADDRDQQRGHEQRLHQLRCERRHRQRRQASRHVADDPHAALVEVQRPRQRGGRDDGEHRPRLGQHVGESRLQAAPQQQRLQTLPDPEQERGGGDADAERDRLDGAELPDERSDDADEVVAARLDAEQVLQLARRDQDAGRGDEPRDDGVGQEARDEAEPGDAHREQDRAGEPGEGEGGGRVVGGALLHHAAEGRGRHQRHDRDGTDGERAAGAEDRVQHDRRDRRVEARLGRQTRQQRVRERLRDQHDRDDHGRQQVARQRAAIVRSAPVEHGQVAGEPCEAARVGCAAGRAHVAGAVSHSLPRSIACQYSGGSTCSLSIHAARVGRVPSFAQRGKLGATLPP